MGWMLTIVLGLVGSLVGGIVSSLVFGTDPMETGFHAGGLITSTIGAVIVLVLYSALQKRRISEREPGREMSGSRGQPGDGGRSHLSGSVK